MFVRLTYFGFKPDKLKDLKKFYNEVAIPTLKKQKGNLDCRLLEPVDKKEDYISMTTWERKEDADAYQTFARCCVSRFHSYAVSPFPFNEQLCPI